jgi:hypothetical protein
VYCIKWRFIGKAKDRFKIKLLVRGGKEDRALVKPVQQFYFGKTNSILFCLKNTSPAK